MGRFRNAFAVGGAALVLASSAPAQRMLPTTLAALDPSRLAELACGARKKGDALKRELLMAAAIAAPASQRQSIPLYPDLATSSFKVTTNHADAQRYFSQGLMLTYGFNHAGAVRSFREAQRLDPDCAMCWWGEAVALGPNINAPMDERDRGAALAAMDRAMALRARTAAPEKALIEAVAHRYSRDAKADRVALDGAYADAMLTVAHQFPDNDDIAVLAAEAAMDTTPWNYWGATSAHP